MVVTFFWFKEADAFGDSVRLVEIRNLNRDSQKKHKFSGKIFTTKQKQFERLKAQTFKLCARVWKFECSSGAEQDGKDFWA